jgi:hypothetical protein
LSTSIRTNRQLLGILALDDDDDDDVGVVNEGSRKAMIPNTIIGN